jgi:hypothetical protein
LASSAPTDRTNFDDGCARPWSDTYPNDDDDDPNDHNRTSDDHDRASDDHDNCLVDSRLVDSRLVRWAHYRRSIAE